MIVMGKFEKRLSKSSKNVENALVIGSGFGKLEEILSVYKTVFVWAPTPPAIKAKNLVYRENFDHINQLTDISAIIFDINQLQFLDITVPVWKRYHSSILIEGNEPIGRDLSKTLYINNYRCVDQQGFYHVWKLQK